MKAGISAALLITSTLQAGSLVIPAKQQPPAVSVGLLNDFLRSQSSAFETWDIGGQFRFRYELKDDAGSFPNRDFISRALLLGFLGLASGFFALASDVFDQLSMAPERFAFLPPLSGLDAAEKLFVSHAPTDTTRRRPSSW